MSSSPVYLAPEHIRRIEPYRPGRPVDLVRRQLGLESICLMASNENPYGPSPLAVEAIQEAASGVNLYPDGGGFHLTSLLARELGVEVERVMLGNGSGELVDLLTRTFVTAGQAVVMSRHGFVQYRLCAQAVNARIVDIAPDPETLVDDLAGMARAANENAARIVFLANPNNPTGSYATRAQLDAYFAEVDPSVLTVVDQAYFEYVVAEDYPDALDDLAAGRNVVVLRTFSKIYGLAGMRVGYAIAAPALLAQVEGVRLPFNTNALGQAAAIAALDDGGHVTSSRQRNLEQRSLLCAALEERGLRYTPSVANFLLVDFGRPAAELYEPLLAQGVLSRPMHGYGFATCHRVTVGSPPENQQLLAAIDALSLGPSSGPKAVNR